MVAIIDYGVGNLFSLRSSLKAIGVDATVSDNSDVIKSADRVILPGVGAFADAAYKLRSHGLDKTVKELASSGKPLLGICLGMQMLFTESFEFGRHEGLDIIKGSVVAMEGRIPKELQIPQIGWNSLSLVSKNPLFKYIKNGDYVYFVHSYYAENCDENLIAYTEYGRKMTAAVSKGNVFGCQFHPEKSGEVGLSILRAFCETGDNI